MIKKLAEFICTLFYFGNSQIAPGTVGSLVALVLIAPLAWSFSFFWLIVAFISATIVGFIFIPIYLGENKKDLQEIVIDEAAGLYLTILIVMLFLKWVDVKISHRIIFISCFLAFRVFDILKPLFVKYFDNIKGTFGIMMDDISAGFLGGITICILVTLYKYCIQ